MIWRMRNYARFQDKIEVSREILVIKDLTCLVGNFKDLTCLVGNLFKASMKNDMLDFNVIKFFGINTRSSKVLRPLPVRWEFFHQFELKLTLMGAARGILVLLLVEVFSVGVWESLLVFSMHFLKFRRLWLLSFMKLYMLWRKLKRWSLLMFGLNMILPWFVLRLLVWLMFRECFIIDGILVFITVGKSSLWVTHIFCEGNACADKLANLGFINKEPFHWYNRLSSCLFLEFFINRYSLLMYRFC